MGIQSCTAIMESYMVGIPQEAGNLSISRSYYTTQSQTQRIFQPPTDVLVFVLAYCVLFYFITIPQNPVYFLMIDRKGMGGDMGRKYEEQKEKPLSRLLHLEKIFSIKVKKKLLKVSIVPKETKAA